MEVRSARVGGLEELRVADVFIPGVREWDAELVRDLFSEEETEEVLSIPVTSLGGEDKRVWHYSKNGEYTVKSGYHVLLERVVPMAHLRVEGGWNDIWQLQQLPRVRVMMWRLARDVLPTQERLGRRGMYISDMCGVCGSGSETNWHLF
ncbi:Putative ribonuclease H protein At1g65750 [Linum perenne]